MKSMKHHKKLHDHLTTTYIRNQPTSKFMQKSYNNLNITVYHLEYKNII